MTPEELLKNGLKELGISCSKEQIIAFMTFLSELKKWSRAYNLTALKTDEDIIIKHFLDSLLYLKAIQEGSSLFTVHCSLLKIADAGTGAGFPGIPIKIIKPEIEITLIESSRKKAAFLRHIVRALKLEKVTVLELRLESLDKAYEKAYDVILSRAAFKVKDFLKKACPYVKENGMLILSKGPKVSEEIKGVNAIKKILKLELPFVKAQRNLLILRC
ncbi:MAG: 16S rRNA (guanine(527)-N(7))-methyltransferase RsmG [Nitrospirae bacterium]|nr:16S rRNA (guanine(527)-N(7))-methyltransferase RsmG [Nitrospirota bacterium]